MPNIPYLRDIPDGPNNPSDDQPNMKINTNSTDDILVVDHFSFNNNLGGLHQWSSYTLDPLDPGAIPPGRLTNQGTVYPKVVSGQTQLFYTPDQTTNEYQITNTNAANFSTFSVGIPYGSPPAGFLQTGGWTWLPGGILYQYGFFGRAASTGTTNIIQYPIPFTTSVFNVQLTAFVPIGQTAFLAVSSSLGFSLTSFNYISSNTVFDGVFWTAIGK